MSSKHTSVAEVAVVEATEAELSRMSPNEHKDYLRNKKPLKCEHCGDAVHGSFGLAMHIKREHPERYKVKRPAQKGHGQHRQKPRSGNSRKTKIAAGEALVVYHQQEEERFNRANFCLYCGKSLFEMVEAPAFCPRCGTPLQQLHEFVRHQNELLAKSLPSHSNHKGHTR